MKLDPLESRKLFAVNYAPDVTWADDGFLSREGSPQFLSVNNDGILAINYFSSKASANNARITRYTADGLMDSSFKTITRRGAVQVATDQSGRPYVGLYDSTTGGMLVTRYAANGNVDATFGTDGSLTIQYDKTLAYTQTPDIAAVAANSDGSTFIAVKFAINLSSDSSPGGRQLFAIQVFKISDDGAIDKSFGRSGKVELSPVESNQEFRSKLFVDSSSRLIAATDGQVSNRIQRFTTAGVLDTTFGDSGFIVPIGIEQSVAIDTQDRLIVADGDEDEDGVLGNGRLRRFTVDGKPDPTFLGGGTFTFDIADGETPQLGAILPQRSGKFLIHFGDRLAQFKSTGTVDRRFEGVGIVDTSEISGAVVGQLRDGSILARNFTKDGRGPASVSKLSPELPAILGRSNTLYINGTEGNDNIDIRGAGSFNTLVVDFDGVRADGTFDDATSIYVNLRDGDDAYEDHYLFRPIPTTVIGGAGNDSITTGLGADSIDAGDGNDTIFTDRGNDAIFAGIGNDNVLSGDGDDIVAGAPEAPFGSQSDNDFYDTDAGNDIIADAYGNNTITTGDGNDSIRTGDGADNIQGGLNNDTIKSGGGTDTLDGGGGRDRLFGMDGNDRILGGSGNDVLVGEEGADTMYGNAGNDLILSTEIDPQTDIIDGGSGDDSLFGGIDDTITGIETSLNLG